MAEPLPEMAEPLSEWPPVSMIREYHALHAQITMRRVHASRFGKSREYSQKQRRHDHFQVVAVFLNYFQLENSADYLNKDCVDYFTKQHLTRDETKSLYLWQFTKPTSQLENTTTLIDAWRNLAHDMRDYAERHNMRASDGTRISKVIQNRLLGPPHVEYDVDQEKYVVRYYKGTHVLGAASTYPDMLPQNRAARAAQELGWLRTWYQNNIAITHLAAQPEKFPERHQTIKR